MVSPRLAPKSLPPDNHLLRFLNARLDGGRLEVVVTERNQLLHSRETDLIDCWLSEEERTQLSRFTFAKRRTEWLLGRICAKQAVLELLSRLDIDAAEPAELRIDTNPSGRPFIIIPETPKLKTVPDISISHSGEKVLGAACTCCCGIDIQVLSETLIEVRDWFCSAAETAVLRSAAQSDLLGLGMLWAAKEAVRKCLNLANPVGFKKMRLIRVGEEQPYRLFELQVDEPAGIGTIPVVVHVDGMYSLGFCTRSRERIDA